MKPFRLPLPAAARRSRAGAESDKPDGPDRGFTVRTIGRQLAPSLEFLRNDAMVLVDSIANVSPFSMAGGLPRTDFPNIPGTDRVVFDLFGSLDERLTASPSDLLIIDNFNAALGLMRVGDSIATVVPGDKSELNQYTLKHFQRNPVALDSLDTQGELFALYQDFAHIIAKHYAPTQILLIEASPSRFFFDGSIQVHADWKRRAALGRSLAILDALLRTITRCASTQAAANYVPGRDAPVWDYAASSSLHEDLTEEVARFATRQPLYWPGFSARPEPVLADRLLGGSEQPASSLSSMIRGATGALASDDILALALQPTLDPVEWQRDLMPLLRASSVATLTRQAVERNQQFLSTYEFNHVSRKTFPRTFPTVALRLDRNTHLIADSAGIKTLALGSDPNFDWRAFTDRGYIASESDIEDAVSSWETYFHRARARDDRPFVLAFDDSDRMAVALAALDLASVLTSERFIVTSGPVRAAANWTPKVSLDFFFDPGTLIVCTRSGLGDQLCNIAFGVAAAGELCDTLVIDDLGFDTDSWAVNHWGPHVRPIAPRLVPHSTTMSSRISARLRRSHAERTRKLGRDNRSGYSELGWREGSLILESDRLSRVVRNTHIVKNRISFSCPVWIVNELESARDAMSRIEVAKLIDVFPLLANEQKVASFKSTWEQIVTVSDFVRDENVEIERLVQSTASIALHVRRGDRARLGMSEDIAWYREALRDAVEFLAPSVAHVFVFSDDLDFCRSNTTELGLDPSNMAITWVDGNDDLATTDDWRLMTSARVIIAAVSGFSGTAAMASRRVERIYGAKWAVEGEIWDRLRDFR